MEIFTFNVFNPFKHLLLGCLLMLISLQPVCSKILVNSKKTPVPITKLSDEFEDATLENMDTEIYADGVPLATAYRFRITNGSDIQTIDKEENVFRMSQLPTFAYNTTYSIDVAVEVDGVWSDYGEAYNVSTSAPLSNISGFLCGATLDNNMEVYADNVPLATKYRFRVINGANEDFVEAEEGFFRFGEQSFLAYNTTYTIDVAVEVDGAWSDYGSACDVTTPAPITKLVDAYCGTILEHMDTEILADGVPLATNYRFRVTEDANVQTVDTEESFFQLTQLPTFAYNTTYSIDVAVEIDGAWGDYGSACDVTTPAPITKLSAEFEDATLENMDTELYADRVPLATAYRFRITNGADVQTIDKEENVFRMSQLPTFAYNTAYSIDVAVEVDGAWSDYGEAYNVSTPAPTTKIANEFCGTVLTNASGEIYADTPPLVTAYRFRVKEGSNEQIIDSESEYLRLSDVSFYAYNTTYTIDVAVEVDGVWSDYGTACEVTTTPTPITKLVDAFCGNTLEHMDTEILADGVPLATAYRFRITNGSDVQTIDKEENVFRMSQLPTFAYNTTYSIDVAVEIDGAWGDYGSACEVTTPAPLSNVSGFLCGTTLDNYMEVYADNVPLATKYRFRVINGANEDFVEAEEGFFRFGEQSFLAYSTIYTIDVAVEVDGVWTDYGSACDVTTPAPITKLSAEFEDATLENMDTELYADGVPLATAYRFRITNGSDVQTIDKEENVFRMSQLPTFAYNTTYNIDVAVEVDGLWSDYGEAYDVSTPAPLTKIATELCGTVLNAADGEIYADRQPLVTAYRFRVKEGSNEQVIDSESEYLKLRDISFFAYNTTYTIDVAVEVDGVWSDYGTACEVTTPTGITNISSTQPDGIYKIGTLIPITVIFSAAVKVTGTPVLLLNSGGTAIYASGDESDALTFNYTVTADEQSEDLDYDQANSLDLSGGTIEDLNGIYTDLSLPTPGNTGSLGASSNIIIDGVLPILNDITIVSNNDDPTMATTGDLVTVSFTSAEAIATPVVTIAGHTATVSNLSNNNWTATYTMTGTDTEGSIPFSIAFDDLAGNSGTNVTATNNSSDVVFTRSILPVVLIDYQVKLQNNSSVLITWHTATERGNKAFELLKSTDGISFSKIATLKGQVNTDATHVYSFTDYAPATGTNYYRLIQIDADGKRNEIGLKTIHFEFQKSNQVVVFPNPGKNFVNISFEEGKFSRLMLTDLTGKILLEETVSAKDNKKTINVSGLATATYIIRLSGPSETVSKLLVTKP